MKDIDYIDDKDKDLYISELLDECYECHGYGDDYYFDDDGDLVSTCTNCHIHKRLKAVGYFN